jgi:AraC family transcriptional regulator
MPQANAILVPSAPLLGTANSILMARARRHSVRDFPGPLSIKAVLDGRVAWRTDGRDILVDSSSFLVLNDGEPYSMEIDAQQPVTTCCVFFAHGFVESVWRDLGRSEEHLLDEPDGLGEPLTFISRLHPRDGRVVPSMRALRDRALAGNCASGLEEGFLLLARDLLLVYEEMRKQLTRVPSARASTRAEMLRRISRGRDFLHAHAYDALTLGQVARAACLSPYHFHRIFTRTFGETPHSYLTRLRLDRAHQLLLSEVPVTEVCNAVGFESLGSFSVLFRKHFGVPPSRFRYPLKA